MTIMVFRNFLYSYFLYSYFMLKLYSKRVCRILWTSNYTINSFHIKDWWFSVYDVSLPFSAWWRCGFMVTCTAGSFLSTTHCNNYRYVLSKRQYLSTRETTINIKGAIINTSNPYQSIDVLYCWLHSPVVIIMLMICVSQTAKRAFYMILFNEKPHF